MDVRKTLYGSIILSGGSTLFQGFGDRLLSEVKPRFDSYVHQFHFCSDLYFIRFSDEAAFSSRHESEDHCPSGLSASVILFLRLDIHIHQ